MSLVDNEVNKEVVDLSIPAIQKTRFRINGDNDKIIWLNTSDANILTRLNKGYKKLMELVSKVSELSEANNGSTSEDALANMANKLEELDTKMREQVDYIFDSNVSEVCLGEGSMYTPKDGKFTFEHIIEALGKLYEDSFTNEFEAMQERLKKHTDKYVKKA